MWGSPGKATPHVRYPGWVLDLAGTIAYMSPNTFGYLNRSPNTLSVRLKCFNSAIVSPYADGDRCESSICVKYLSLLVRRSAGVNPVSTRHRACKAKARRTEVLQRTANYTVVQERGVSTGRTVK